MKLKIQPKTKKYSLIGASLCIITLILMIPMVIKFFKIGYAPNTLYNYKYTPQINYTVGVLNHDLYEEDLLKEDQYYLLKFIDKIYPTFSFELKGSSVAQITGEYQIITQIRGYTTKEQKQQVIWEKQDVLVPKVAIELESDYLKKEHELVIDLNDYKEFVEKIFEHANIRTDVEVCLKIEGKLKINEKSCEIEVPIDTSMTIPLGQNYFTVMKKGEEIQTENIIDTAEGNSLQIKYIILTEVIVGMIGIGIFIGILRADYFTQEEIRERVIKKIFRIYGSRLIGVNHLPQYPSDRIYELGYIQDLIKIAEELEQPIFYLSIQELTKVECFYIFDKERLYFYRVP